MLKCLISSKLRKPCLHLLCTSVWSSCQGKHLSWFCVSIIFAKHHALVGQRENEVWILCTKTILLTLDQVVGVIWNCNRSPVFWDTPFNCVFCACLCPLQGHYVFSLSRLLSVLAVPNIFRFVRILRRIKFAVGNHYHERIKRLHFGRKCNRNEGSDTRGNSNRC